MRSTRSTVPKLVDNGYANKCFLLLLFLLKVETHQSLEISSSLPSTAYYAPASDETISDLNTGLMWTKNYFGRMARSDADPSSVSGRKDKLAAHQSTKQTTVHYLILFFCFFLHTLVGGYKDWRIPTVKELYSLIDFSGEDISGEPEDADTSTFIPFLDTSKFEFAYGGDGTTRLIDVQFITTTDYVAAASANLPQWFGVNFADGRIKGYPDMFPTYFVRYVRGNTAYGVNSFTNNADGTVSDSQSGLMWEQADSGMGMVWEDALTHCESQTTGGHDNWRLPDAKELHTLIDYTRSPDTTSSAAIDAVFSVSTNTNENSQTDDYPYFWSSTTHKSSSGLPGGSAVYFSFGRAMGFFDSMWQDVHGAGSQKSDPKAGDPANYPTGNGPQGDAVRILNYVRCVRTETPGVFGGPPTNPPTPAPTAAPTPTPTTQTAPTEAPTSAPSPCFSADMMVHVQDKGIISMRDLQVGDMVLSGTQADGSKKYQRIYAFGHWDDSTSTTYLQIYSVDDISTPQLELSGNHLLFVKESNYPVRADMLQPGSTKILRVQSDGTNEAVPISHIQEHIIRNGAYLPLTPDGTIIVNNVSASTYVSIHRDAPATITAFQTLFLVSEQRLFHWWLSPYRLICQTNPYASICQAGHWTNEEGILLWLVWGQNLAKFGEQCHVVVRCVGILWMLLVFACLACLETLILSYPLVAGVFAAVSVVVLAAQYYLRTNKRPKALSPETRNENW
jgi:hypothetical protein